MIAIHRLTIHESRGLRHHALELKGQKFAISGQNGSGKSGVVDAFEFVLTGTVSRRSRRGDLSVKEHGPHVDSTPEQAYVEAVVTPTPAAPFATAQTPACWVRPGGPAQGLAGD